MKSRFLACTALGALVLVGACKDDGRTNGGGEFLTVVLTVPADDQMDVPVVTRIGFQVSEPINASTLTDDTFFVTDEDGAMLSGALMVTAEDPTVAELVLDGPLSVISDYSATITTGLRGRSGGTLEEDFEWNFRTLDSEWGDSEWLEETGTGISNRARVDVDPQLNATAVWEYETASGTEIWANRYTRIDIWGAPERIDSATGGAARPAVAADGLGNAFAVWAQTPEGAAASSVWVNRYDGEQGSWVGAQPLQADPGQRARLATVAADLNGNAIAIWVEDDTETVNELVLASRYEPATGWATPQPIGSEAATSILVGTTSVGMDDAGNAIAVWSRGTVTGDILLANRYEAGTWGTAELVKSELSTAVQQARLSVGAAGDGAAGDAFLIWTQVGEARDDIWAARWSDSTWEDPERIDDYDADSKSEPDIAVDGAGVAHAVWSQSDPEFANIWARRYTPGSGWAAMPELIEPPNEDPLEDADATTPQIDTNSAGNTFVVWRQNWRDWPSIWSNRLDPDGPWMTAERIESIGRPGTRPQIAVDEERHAHSVWIHERSTGGINWVRTNRFE